MRSSFISLLLAAAAVYAADAEAKPRRVVVLDFDGPRQLADTGRSAVMSVLGEQYNIVATKTWDAARARASGRGPQQWRQASKQAGVDAVIEGWVQPEGRHHVMTIAVRDAATGNEIDTFSIRIRERGVTSDASHRLAVQLDDLLSWIDADVTAEPTSQLPDVRTVRPLLGARDPYRDRDRADDRDDRVEEPEDGDDRPRRRGKVRRAGRDDGAADARDAEAEEHERAERREPPATTAVAAIDQPAKDTSDLVTLFGPESREAAIVSEGKTAHVPRPTPRFLISAGGYLSSRGMLFTHDSEARTFADYPAQPITGFAARAEVYPFPHQRKDGRLSGLGFTLDLAQSVGALLTAQDETGTGDYTLDHTVFETGVHYRWPVDLVSIDASASYGQRSYELPSDFPGSVAIPDTSYSYLGAAVHVDLAIGERASVGAGARYMYLLDAGMVTEQDWYGAGKARGFALDGSFVIPLPNQLYLRGGVEYSSVKVDFEGSGRLSRMWGVWEVVDSAITGTAAIGIAM